MHPAYGMRCLTASSTRPTQSSWPCRSADGASVRGGGRIRQQGSITSVLRFDEWSGPTRHGSSSLRLAATTGVCVSDRTGLDGTAVSLGVPARYAAQLIAEGGEPGAARSRGAELAFRTRRPSLAAAGFLLNAGWRRAPLLLFATRPRPRSLPVRVNGAAHPTQAAASG